MPEVLIFTDLDGTLLDHSTYSFTPAQEALNLIKTKHIPLILCSSKTRKEIEYYNKSLNNTHPFIAENGGGIFIPQNYFTKDFAYDLKIDGYKVIQIGTRRENLTKALKEVSTETGIAIKTFSDMSLEEISKLTSLDQGLSALAKDRDFSEPFILEDEKYSATVAEQIALKGYTHTRGGRFHHILGGNDKGKALNMLKNLYESEYGQIESIGLGDSLNDLPMLKAADIPIVVQKPGGEYDPNINLANLTYADGIGPHGWNSAILKLFMNYD